VTSKMTENTQNDFPLSPAFNVLFFLLTPLKYNFVIRELDFLIQELYHSMLSFKDGWLDVSRGLINQCLDTHLLKKHCSIDLSSVTKMCCSLWCLLVTVAFKHLMCG